MNLPAPFETDRLAPPRKFKGEKKSFMERN
jgi:hypothetical protein